MNIYARFPRDETSEDGIDQDARGPGGLQDVWGEVEVRRHSHAQVTIFVCLRNMEAVDEIVESGLLIQHIFRSIAVSRSGCTIRQLAAILQNNTFADR